MQYFHDRIAKAITVQSIQTPIGKALAFDEHEKQSSAHEALRQADFDHAPVYSGGGIVGRIGRNQISSASHESLATLVTPLHGGIVVAADSPIDELIGWFQTQPFLFVLDGKSIQGIATVSDLNKQPARTYLYALAAGLEMALADAIRKGIENQTGALNYLSDERADKAHRVLEEADGQQADVVSALELADLLKVFGKSPLARSHGFRSRNHWEDVTGSLVDFRNAVSHPVSPLVRGNHEIEKLNAQLENLHVVLKRLSATTEH